MGVLKRPAKAKKGQKQYWYMRCQYKGREHWESTGKRVGEITKDEANRMFLDWKEEIKTGIKITRTIKSDLPDSPTLYEFSKEYVKQKKDEGKVSWERDVYSINNLMEFFGPDAPLSSIDAKGVSKYKIHRLKTRKPETINHELICLGAIINLARDWEIWNGKNPVKVSGLLKYNKEKRTILAPGQDDLLISTASEYFGYIITGALNTAMRRIEIVRAHKDHLNLKQKYIYIPPSKTTDPRKVPLNTTMMDLIPTLIKRSKDGYLFTNRLGYRYQDANSLSLLFSRLCKKLNFKEISFHSLRHTAATRMLEGKEDSNGNKRRASLVDVQLILGHKNPKTTMIYLHPEDSLIEAVELLG